MCIFRTRLVLWSHFGMSLKRYRVPIILKMIYEGDPINSDKYMTVPRFFNTLFGRFQTQEQAAIDIKGIVLEEAGELAFVQAMPPPL